ncbi:hypothetical protein SAMN04515674_102261 [Pseudarcicella hirudinis]|uniref:Holin n=1 Tax=Pseudarcicella hirudinis TaxID=1079859 RepID=A0A1I5P4B0_9BACT|nr:hypothetical protein [Pseudarcicella hirudinis]SFP28680.1 hypothetical protein SAMN04515674_102261 [Pseudarcicella hirudinis]
MINLEILISTPDVINNIVAGGLLGILGQGIRVIVGLKKANDAAQSTAQAQSLAGDKTASSRQVFNDNFDTKRFVLSLFIGFVAGALAIMFSVTGSQLNQQAILTTLAAGYAGTDFIEGLLNKYVNGK